MRVFVTGASGFIGSAVVPELVRAGHQVVGLARSDASAAAIQAVGGDVLRGGLDDLDGLRAGAQASDGVIHLAFIHDFANFAQASQVDQRAIETLGGALEGTNKPLVVASGLLGLTPGRIASERDDPNPNASPRVAGVQTALSFAERAVRTSIVRLPPTVHGEGDHGFVPRLIDIAREKGFAAYVGDGANRWPAVHRLDAARLFRLALERANAGSRLHAVGDGGVPIREVAGVIGRRLGIPVVSKSAAEAGDYFGFLAHMIALDLPCSCEITRAELGWATSELGLVADLDRDHYFAPGKRSALL
ncbi:MAG: SDR family oxidoreductase [Polyangiaceae bacterium]|nr:SDR family oxidoreductase [Polyangiaceae bacterium]